MTNTAETLTILASVASAVGGVFAARAAFLSAKSAREVKHAADDMQLRGLLREVATTAGAVLVEVKRIQSVGNEVQHAYRALAVLSGAYGNSRMQLYIAAVDEKLNEAKTLAEDSKLFSDGARSIADCPPAEIERVLLRQALALTTTRAMREDLERENTSLEVQRLQMVDKR